VTHEAISLANPILTARKAFSKSFTISTTTASSEDAAMAFSQTQLQKYRGGIRTGVGHSANDARNVR
jgi:hypothetical protein